MPLLLDGASPDFHKRLTEFIDRKRASESEVGQEVSAIVDAVQRRGDEAVFEYTSRFDMVELSSDTVRVGPEEMLRARESCSSEALDALQTAADRIKAFHERQRPDDLSFQDVAGVELGHRWTPISTVGLYVPGGTAAYPSSVLMNAVPALVAGVERIVMVVPAPNGILNPLVLAAASTVGVGEIYKIGGAQAVAAMAFGTESIPKVDKVVGPGNIYVATAKRLLFGTIGIDLIAGPSEILVVADNSADPAWLAADLLSQAEHDPASQAILITDDPDLAKKVGSAVDQQIGTLSRSEIARKSWGDHGAIITLDAISQAPEVIDQIAPEHLELVVKDPETLLGHIKNAGAIFIGPYTPEAIGDYVGGPNHVLPTSGTARFASGLSVIDFMKRTNLIKCDEASFAALAPAAECLANLEGLDAHALSLEIRRRPS